MDGPDLSHLLDGTNPDKPSSEVLHGIVRRHRRLKVRRARTAASLGLAIALAGLGTGIGLSHQGRTTTAARSLAPTTTRGGVNAFGSTTSTTLGARGSTSLPTPAASKLRFGRAPEGLAWVGEGSGVGASAGVVPSDSPVVGLHATASTSGPMAAAVCTTIGCPSQFPYDLVGDSVLQPLFTRTSGGVTVRAFSASWAVAPIELGPISSGSGSTGASSSAGTVGSSGGSGTLSSSPPVTGTVPGDTTIPDTTIPDTTTTTTLISGVTQTTTPVSEPPTPVPSPSCGITKALVVEVSDAGAVGVVTVPLGASLDKPIDVVMDDVVGVAEQSPMVVVVAHTNNPTAAVRADFGVGGQDQMDVVDQWAVLVKDLGSSAVGGHPGMGDPELLEGQATVSALSSDGTVLEQADLPGSGALAMPVAVCIEPASSGVTKPVGEGASSPTTTQVGG
jgi:hypothetical protein